MKGKDMDNRPNGRKTTITGTGTGLNKKGSGIGGGPAGRPGGYSGRGSSSAEAAAVRYARAEAAS